MLLFGECLRNGSVMDFTAGKFLTFFLTVKNQLFILFGIVNLNVSMYKVVKMPKLVPQSNLFWFLFLQTGWSEFKIEQKFSIQLKV